MSLESAKDLHEPPAQDGAMAAEALSELTTESLLDFSYLRGFAMDLAPQDNDDLRSIGRSYMPSDMLDSGLGTQSISTVQDRASLEEKIERNITILDDMLRSSPQEYQSIMEIQLDIGYAYYCLREYKSVVEYLEQALEVQSKILHTDNPDSTALRIPDIPHHLIMAHSALGNHQKAREYYEQALVRDKILRSDHQHMAMLYNSMGMAQFKLGHNQRAIESYEKALEIHQKILPIDHQHIANLYTDIGTAQFKLGNYQKARKYYEHALEIRKKILPIDHQHIANLYTNIGTAHFELGNYQKAIEYYEHALEIRQKILPPDHQHIANLYNSMGMAHFKLGNYQKAIEYYEHALEIRQKILPPDHPDIATIFCNISDYYNRIDDQQKALEYYAHAEDIMKNPCHVEGISIDAISNKIARLKLKIDTQLQKADCAASATAVSSEAGASAEDASTQEEDAKMKGAIQAQPAASGLVDKGLSDQTRGDLATPDEDTNMVREENPSDMQQAAAAAAENIPQDEAKALLEYAHYVYADIGRDLEVVKYKMTHSIDEENITDVSIEALNSFTLPDISLVSSLKDKIPVLKQLNENFSHKELGLLMQDSCAQLKMFIAYTEHFIRDYEILNKQLSGDTMVHGDMNEWHC